MIKLAIITTHPIQYNAPLFRMLTQRNNIALKIFYTWSQSESGIKFDPGFGKDIEWDLPLLDGYDYMFSENIASSPGSHHYKGIDNPHLIKEINEWSPNALLVYGWNFKSHFKTMRYYKGKIPVLFRGDSTLLDERLGLKRLVRRLILKFIYAHVDIALYAGEANKAYFVAHSIKENDLVFMPHAIDNNRFAYSIQNNELAKQLRAKVGVPENALLFLYAGKLDENKNIGLLIQAFLDCKNNEAYLLVTGNGPLETNLKALYASNKNILFLDFQNQQMMPALYACSNVFVLPSKSETWGLSINEAMAAGKAIVLSNSCGASFDLVCNGENGFVFKKNDLLSLKNALQYFIDNNNASTKMGEISLNKIKTYSYEKDCIALENILEKMNNKIRH